MRTVYITKWWRARGIVKGQGVYQVGRWVVKPPQGGSRDIVLFPEYGFETLDGAKEDVRSRAQDEIRSHEKKIKRLRTKYLEGEIPGCENGEPFSISGE